MSKSTLRKFDAKTRVWDKLDFFVAQVPAMDEGLRHMPQQYYAIKF